MKDDNDITLQSYQDDLNDDDSAIDPIMAEETEEPAEEIGIPLDEYRDELDKQDFGDHNESGDDDWRESMEDQEKDPNGTDE